MSGEARENKSGEHVFAYYPGCTLHTWASGLNRSAVAALGELGIRLSEMPDWTCCQAVFPLAQDSIAGLISPARILIQARKQADSLTTLCSFCFNVLRRTNLVLRNDPDKRGKVNAYLEEDYQGDLEVVHPLEILRDTLGFTAMETEIKRPLHNLKVASYYGCQLVRPPKEMQFDDPEDPKLLDFFLTAVGCTVVEHPHKVECCGSFQALNDPEAVLDRAYMVLHGAQKNGAEALALSCPLCFYNLEVRQEQVRKRHPDLKPIPVFYFTELLGVAMGLDAELFDLQRHSIDPMPLLRSKDFRERSTGSGSLRVPDRISKEAAP